MAWEIIYVFAVLATAIVLFVSDKVRLDLVALLVVIALVLANIITAKEGLSGFGATVVILIAGLFVVGEGLAQTGVSFAVGDKIVKIAGKGEVKLIALLMVSVALLSAFMSSTGAVAIFVPVAIRLATKSNIPPSRFLMPLAFGALIGGMLTLIGTPPNIVVSAQLETSGYAPFNFFDFTPIGIMILALGIGYFALFGRKLLGRSEVASPNTKGRRTVKSLLKTYEIEDDVARLIVDANSDLIGKTVVEAKLRSLLGFTVFGIMPAANPKSIAISAHADTPFAEGDIIYGVMADNTIEKEITKLDLTRLEKVEDDYHMSARELGLADVIITAQSDLVGRTLVECEFRKLYDLGVVAIMRKGKSIHSNFAEIPLEFGDQLLVVGDWKDVKALRQERHNFLVVSFPEEIKDLIPKPQLAWASIGIVALMLVLIVTKLVPTSIAVTIAAVLMVLSGCVSSRNVYNTINWQSLVLIAGMLPMAIALEKTGGLQLIVDTLMDVAGDSPPAVMLVALFVITSLFSQVISNTATSVLIAPVAIGAAQMMDVSPLPFLMAVAVAASTSFATPVASPVNMIVLGPGGYRFKDFLIVGLPLQILALILASIAIPIFFPFH